MLRTLTKRSLGDAERPALPQRVEKVEAELCRLFSELLNISDVQPDSDFFVLEGDSLNAVNVMAYIEKHFGVSLPVSVIVEAPTPRLLAKIVDAADALELTTAVVRVQERGEGSPLFVVHGVAGDVAYARRIAESLGPTRPVYGLRAIGLRAGEEPIPCVRDMAARYVSELRSVRPHGPYFLHGYCGGSFIAYEMAQQLRQAGEGVKGLVMVEPPLDWRRSPFLVASDRRLNALMAVARMRLEWARLRSLFRDRTSHEYRRVLIARTLWSALANYVPEPLHDRALVLFCTRKRDILLNQKRGLQHLMPMARFVDCGSARSSLFAKGARGLVETRAFLEELDPVHSSRSVQLAIG